MSVRLYCSEAVELIRKSNFMFTLSSEKDKKFSFALVFIQCNLNLYNSFTLQVRTQSVSSLTAVKPDPPGCSWQGVTPR